MKWNWETYWLFVKMNSIYHNAIKTSNNFPRIHLQLVVRKVEKKNQLFIKYIYEIVAVNILKMNILRESIYPDNSNKIISISGKR